MILTIMSRCMLIALLSTAHIQYGMQSSTANSSDSASTVPTPRGLDSSVTEPSTTNSSDSGGAATTSHGVGSSATQSDRSSSTSGETIIHKTKSSSSSSCSDRMPALEPVPEGLRGRSAATTSVYKSTPKPSPERNQANVPLRTHQLDASQPSNEEQAEAIKKLIAELVEKNQALQAKLNLAEKTKGMYADRQEETSRKLNEKIALLDTAQKKEAESNTMYLGAQAIAEVLSSQLEQEKKEKETITDDYNKLQKDLAQRKETILELKNNTRVMDADLKTKQDELDRIQPQKTKLLDKHYLDEDSLFKVHRLLEIDRSNGGISRFLQGVAALTGGVITALSFYGVIAALNLVPQDKNAAYAVAGLGAAVGVAGAAVGTTLVNRAYGPFSINWKKGAYIQLSEINENSLDKYAVKINFAAE